MEFTASCSMEISTPTKDIWNYIPVELLIHIFAYLPLEDRHSAFSVCQRWAEAVSTPSVWSSTEVSFNTVDACKVDMLVRLHWFLEYIEHLKIVVDQTQSLYRSQVTKILDTLVWRSHNVRALCIVCRGDNIYFYSCPDILQSFRRLLALAEEMDFQYIDLQKTSFNLNNDLILWIAFRNPNLHTLLINNHRSGLTVLRPDTIVGVLRWCPKLSALGIHLASFSEDVFHVLLKPSRGPLKFLGIFCEGEVSPIPEEVWSALTERHPKLRVGLEFGPLVHTVIISRFLKPNIPVSALRFNGCICMVNHIRYITDTYFRTLEKLVFYTSASENLNQVLIELALGSENLKEIYCSCPVSPAVINAFLAHCPRLIRCTLKKNALY
ncbi:F-box/LRR-repeat protein 8-like [Hemicordylus capensis]|uniref:F-box/LRR-repeat protein 8-like n=1 Tax=Hemicordylus capensis TaxID=884348 RepID=UPI0023034B35|nr:F-box/LRR-repeat protein 8-like [Hemicordylus capensis]XP_053127313.1 F-box/LRR-repeat protein 8-like [Hemicordylus capensis]